MVDWRTAYAPFNCVLMNSIDLASSEMFPVPFCPVVIPNPCAGVIPLLVQRILAHLPLNVLISAAYTTERQTGGWVQRQTQSAKPHIDPKILTGQCVNGLVDATTDCD